MEYGYLDKEVKALVAERDRLAEENAELRKRDGSGLIAEAERLMVENAELKRDFAALNETLQNYAQQVRQVQAELANANATLDRLRKCELDPSRDGDPYNWTRGDLVSTLQALQSILYPKETDNGN